ncbi:MAG: hypothetical protein WBM44_05715 [Waterburya sp.]
MVFTEYMKVKNNLIVDTKYGKRRVINLVANNGGEGAVWATDLDSLTHIKPNQTVEVIRGAKGNLTILEREQPRNVNGNGLKPIKEVLENVTPDSQVPENYIDDDLGLPKLMSDAEKVRLSKLIRERAKLLTHTIEVMRDELNSKGLEFHEGSIRSLSVSLFINISTILQRPKSIVHNTDN